MSRRVEEGAFVVDRMYVSIYHEDVGERGVFCVEVASGMGTFTVK